MLPSWQAHLQLWAGGRRFLSRSKLYPQRQNVFFTDPTVGALLPPEHDYTYSEAKATLPSPPGPPPTPPGPTHLYF